MTNSVTSIFTSKNECSTVGKKMQINIQEVVSGNSSMSDYVAPFKLANGSCEEDPVL